MNPHLPSKSYYFLLKPNKTLYKNPGLYTSVKITICIYALCFMTGGLGHWLDIVREGMLPYKGIPILLNYYLTSLAIFDFVVAVLLFLRPIYGLTLALIIMVSDLLIDFHLSYKYWHSPLSENKRLELLLLFGISLLFTTPFLIKFLKNRKQD